MAAVASSPVSDSSASRGGKGRAPRRQRNDRPTQGQGKPSSAASSSASSSAASSSSQTPSEKAEAAEKFRERYKKELAAIEKTHKEQVALKARRESIEAQIQATRLPTADARKRKTELHAALKEIGARRSVMVSEQKAWASRLEDHKRRQQAFKEYVEASGLPYKLFRNEDFQQKNFEIIDERKRLLQQQFERKQLTTIEEKTFVRKIAEVDRKKAIVREVMKRKAELDTHRPEGKTDTDAAWEALKAQQTQTTAELDKLTQQIGQSEEKVTRMLQEIKSIREQLQALSEKWTKQQQQLTNKKEADREARKLKLEQEKLERAARQAEQKKRQEEKARQEALILPFEHEKEVADGLIAHLRTLSKTKKGAIAHPLRVYASFEILAVPPPLTPGEVETCLATVQAKRDFMKAQRKAEKEKRAQEDKKRLEASAAAASSSSTSGEQAEPVAEADVAPVQTEELAAPATQQDEVEQAPPVTEQQEVEPTSQPTEAAAEVGDE